MSATAVQIARQQAFNVEQALALLDRLAVVAENVETTTTYGDGLKYGCAKAYRDAAQIVRDALHRDQ